MNKKIFIIEIHNLELVTLNTCLSWGYLTCSIISHKITWEVCLIIQVCRPIQDSIEKMQLSSSILLNYRILALIHEPLVISASPGFGLV